MKIIITENQLRKVQFKFLNYLFEDIYEVEFSPYPNFRFWKKDDDFVLELVESGNLIVSLSIWNNISDIFSLDYNETQQLIKEWAEQHLELEGITPALLNTFDALGWNNI